MSLPLFKTMTRNVKTCRSRRSTRLSLQSLESRLTPTAIPAPPGLLSWWPGDGDPTDIVGPNSGTILNGATCVQGNVGDGFQGTGLDSRVEASATSLPVGTADRTIEFWARVDSQIAPYSFLAAYGTPGTGGAMYELFRQADGHVVANHWGSTELLGPVMAFGQWYHVATTNVSTASKLYLNGVEVASGTFSFGTPAGTGFWIGGIPGYSWSTDGIVDEVSVYDRALNATEIQSIYQAGHDGKLKPYMIVNSSTPTEGAAVTTPPTLFVIDFNHPVLPPSIQASDFVVNSVAASSFTIVDPDTIRFEFATSPVSTPGPQTMAMSAGAVSASDGALQPALHSWSKQFNYLPPIPPPTVTAVQINDGSTQRSRVTSVTVTFSEVVSFPNGTETAFALTRNGPGGSTGIVDLNTAANGTSSLIVGDEAGYLRKYDADTGTFVSNLAAIPHPGGVAYGPNGNIFFAQRSTPNVLVLNPTTGSVIETITPGNLVTALAFDTNQDLFVTSYLDGSIRQYDLPTKSSSLFATYASTVGIAITSNGTVFASSLGNPVVRKYDSSGIQIGSISVGGAAHGLAIGPDGYLYAAAWGPSRIVRINPQTLTSSDFVTNGSGGLNTPQGICFDHDGNLLVANENPPTVKKYDRYTGAYLGNFVSQGPGGGITGSPTYLAVSPISANTVTITFDSGGVIGLDPGGCLLDGNYTLTVLANHALGNGQQLDGNGDGTPGDNYTFNVHRLFGDADGDGDVDTTDFGALRMSFGGVANVFDFDNDGVVDAADYTAFRQRFGTFLP